MTPTMRTTQCPHRFVLFSLFNHIHLSSFSFCDLLIILLSKCVYSGISCFLLALSLLWRLVLSCPVVSPVSSCLFTSCHVFKVFFSYLMYYCKGSPFLQARKGFFWGSQQCLLAVYCSLLIYTFFAELSEFNLIELHYDSSKNIQFQKCHSV